MKHSLKEKELAALSYLWIFSLFVWHIKNPTHFVKNHARQGLRLFVLSVIFFISSYFISFLFYGNIIVLLFSIIGIFESLEGKNYNLPFFRDKENVFQEMNKK
ncbi:hypothetical protein COB57_01370 [Candidatus Peregrinibacteria bacterium]|nr:MAG: hypothetical protein COB57_01370 [Candidatus Peregrinibacteria bacterium]